MHIANSWANNKDLKNMLRYAKRYVKRGEKGKSYEMLN